MRHKTVRVTKGFAYDWDKESWYVCPILTTLSPHPDYENLNDYDDAYVSPSSTEYVDILERIINDRDQKKTEEYDLDRINQELNPEESEEKWDINEYDDGDEYDTDYGCD
jgi:hypothetical protein